MSQLGVVVLQETVRRRRGREEEARRRTILEVLTDRMDGGDAATVAVAAGRRSFKQRLRFTGIGCCGAGWGFGRMAAAATITVGDVDNDNDDDDEEGNERHNISTPPPHPPPRTTATTTTNLSQLLIMEAGQGCSGPVNNSNSGSGMNLAAALAAERHFREADESVEVPPTPARVSLMRLLEETEAGGGGDAAEAEMKGRENHDINKEAGAVAGGLGCDSVCCVCMGRKKGAAFIPCGHTFCRVCSREVWLNRGSCPLCNRTILEILDIF